MIKEWMGALSVVVVVLVTILYVRQMLAGKIKPHLFTWVIWTLTTGIAAAARTTEHAGAGAWGQWAAAASCLIVVILALRQGEKGITRSDQIAFGLALLAMPLWQLTENALAAVVMVTGIDLLGYYPTFRKSWVRPHEEAIFNYVAANVIHILSLFATEQITLVNVLFQVAVFTANTLLIIMVLIRRAALARQNE
ncbi:MAG: hypothetical protein KBA75_03895 [Alphaproteobacteria bacterium]|nr:hypothetical protein [Alphaproteobacteria bacterium]